MAKIGDHKKIKIRNKQGELVEIWVPIKNIIFSNVFPMNEIYYEFEVDGDLYLFSPNEILE